MLVLNAKEVHEALPMATAIAAMKQAMAALSSGAANIPERIHLDCLKGTTLVMPGNVEGKVSALVVKVVSIFNNNHQQGLSNILGIVNVLDADTGKPLATMNGAAITAIRTAATSAAATDLLAHQDANTLAIIGSGAQARSHFHAIRCVRSIRQCRFFAPRAERVASMIDELRNDLGSTAGQVELIAASSSAEATRDADMVCTTTNSSVPVIEDSAVEAGCHINAIGSYKPSVVEIPEATVVRSCVFVDQLEHALAEAGDLIQPIEAGKFSKEQIAGELGQLVLGKVPGRERDEQVTLFKSVGNTVQDTFAAQMAFENAKRLGLGTEVEM